MTWREVLQSKGWERIGKAGRFESWRNSSADDHFWWVQMERLEAGKWTTEGKWLAYVQAGRHVLAQLYVEELLDESTDTDEAAFASLMAKPIGPGRVTVGVLLGVAV
jgi:hypothetical protein